jgi:hypothetical protein
MKKYTIEIHDCDNPNKERKHAYLQGSEDIELLFEHLKSKDEIIEFTGQMRYNEVLLHDEFDDIYLEDYNIIEMTNIKKVRKSDGGEWTE